MAAADQDTASRSGDRRFLLGALAITALLRLQGLQWPLKPDESGFLLVSRVWHPSADSLYGPLFVDRPPPLIALYRVFDWVGGAYGPRIASALLVLLLVYAAYRTGLVLGGVAAARWAAVVAVALSGQPDLEMWAAKSESLGVPFVVVSCWLTLEALHAGPGRRRELYAAASGVAGAVAIGMKQNLVGGAVFGVVLLAVALRTKRLSLAEDGRVAAAAVAGFAIPVLAVLGWALAAGVELHTIWDTLYGFRGDAFAIITAGHMDAPLERLAGLGLLFVTTGLAVVLGWFVVRLRPSWQVHPEATVAALAMVLVDAMSLLLSGSYWTPYLTALFPGAILAVAILSSTAAGRGRTGTRVVVALCAVSMVVSTIGWTAGHLLGGSAPEAHYVGLAVAEVAEPDDTIVVLYGRADIVLASGLQPVYEHLWSLPARTLDPDLSDLEDVLAGDRAPTWLVAWSYLNSWGIDDDGSLRQLIAKRYVAVGKSCEGSILLRRDVVRPAIPEIDCDRPWR